MCLFSKNMYFLPRVLALYAFIIFAINIPGILSSCMKIRCIRGICSENWGVLRSMDSARSLLIKRPHTKMGKGTLVRGFLWLSGERREMLCLKVLSQLWRLLQILGIHYHHHHYHHHTVFYPGFDIFIYVTGLRSGYWQETSWKKHNSIHLLLLFLFKWFFSSLEQRYDNFACTLVQFLKTWNWNFLEILFQKL